MSHTPLLAVSLVALSPLAASAAIVIDDFTTPSPAPVVATLEGFGVAQSVVAPDVVGGVRDLTVTAEVLTIPVLDTVSAVAFSGGGASVLNYSSTAGADGYLSVRYGMSALSGAAMNIDATGQDIQIQFVRFDSANNQPLSIQTWVVGNESAVWGLPTVMLNAPGAQTATIPTASLPSAVRADIDGILFIFNAAMATDFRIDSIAVVPEPASLSLLGLLAAPLFRRRR